MSRLALVIGKNGQLGQSIQKLLNKNLNLKDLMLNHNGFEEEYICTNINFIFVSRDELDLSNSDEVTDYFQKNHFFAIINCAAYTYVDKAESDIKEAEKINHLAVAQLAEISKIQNIPLIHISTDFVFSGKISRPYLESDKTNPLNVYGTSKLNGEKYMLKSGCVGAIIRTSWLYSEFKNNFVKTILDLGKKNKSLTVINDQFGSPTYSINLAKLILNLLCIKRTNKLLNSNLQIYHYSDDGICSWYDLAKTIYELNYINCEITPIESKNYPQKAVRPQYSALNTNKIKNHLPQLEIPYWKESLINCLSEIKSK